MSDGGILDLSFALIIGRAHCRAFRSVPLMFMFNPLPDSTRPLLYYTCSSAPAMVVIVICCNQA